MKLRCRPLAFTSHKVFLKTKRGLEVVSLPHSHVLLTVQSSCSLLLEIMGNMCIVSFVSQALCKVINFEMNVSFPSNPVSNMTKKSGQELEYLTDEKSF